MSHKQQRKRFNQLQDIPCTLELVHLNYTTYLCQKRRLSCTHYMCVLLLPLTLALLLVCPWAQSSDQKQSEGMCIAVHNTVFHVMAVSQKLPWFVRWATECTA